MRHRSLFGFLIAAPMLAVSASFSAAMAGVGALLRLCLDLLQPEPYRLAPAGPAMPRLIGGTAVDGAMLHSRRHEAGVSRRSAARNT